MARVHNPVPMASEPHTIKFPPLVWQAFEHLWALGETGPLRDYPSKNAAAVGYFVYGTIFFQKAHDLTGKLARMHPDDQQTVHRFVLHCMQENVDLGALLPKPMNAGKLLAVAKRTLAAAAAFRSKEPSRKSA